jgi:2-dehydro-3-deoxyphosphogluconate aldolase/(4S)-4-hydroxy-2-oxoglutarate aldolase
MGALREGMDVVKLFPAAALGGLQMLAALSAPFPSLRFIPTGGITLAELPEYARQRSVLAVGGSWIAPRGLISAGRFAEITNLASQSVAAVAAARNGPTGPEVESARS